MKKELVFLKKRHRSNSISKDVSVNIQKNGKGRRNKISLTFRNKSYLKITRTGYITIAIYEERIYFMAEDGLNGYKLSSTPNCKGDNRYITIQPEEPESPDEIDYMKWAETHTGDFDLLFDKEEGLWYVDTEY